MWIDLNNEQDEIMEENRRFIRKLCLYRSNMVGVWCRKLKQKSTAFFLLAIVVFHDSTPMFRQLSLTLLRRPMVSLLTGSGLASRRIHCGLIATAEKKDMVHWTPHQSSVRRNP
jgi:hypothetical protein